MDKAVIEKFGIISENAAGAVVFQNFVVNTHGSSKIAAEILVQGVIDRLQSILDELRNKAPTFTVDSTNESGRKKKDYFWPECSCLDSAYERKAIDEGMNNTPVFPENIEYLKQLRRKS